MQQTILNKNMKTKKAIHKKTKSLLLKTSAHIVIILGCIIFIFPFVWLLSTSFKTEAKMFAMPPQIIPIPFTLDNYRNMFRYFPLFLYLKNTILLTALNICGTVISSSCVAYAFARLKWPGRDILFFILLGTMMIPGQVTMIPLYILFRKLNWVDTFYPLWVPSFFGSAFNIFLIRQFLLTIPKELEEAAIIDGASYYQIFYRIMLPLIRPVLITVVIFTFMGTWNDFMGPLIYLNSNEKFTLSLGLRVLQQGHSSEPGIMMATATLMTLPVIAFFFAAQKQFIEGVVLTGLKE